MSIFSFASILDFLTFNCSTNYQVKYKVLKKRNQAKKYDYSLSSHQVMKSLISEFGLGRMNRLA